jgi:hypothetical protein
VVSWLSIELQECAVTAILIVPVPVRQTGVLPGKGGLPSSWVSRAGDADARPLRSLMTLDRGRRALQEVRICDRTSVGGVVVTCPETTHRQSSE